MNRCILILLALAVLFSGSSVAQTWEQLGVPQVATAVSDISVTASGTHVFVADDSYLLKSTNSGQGYAVTPLPYTAPLVVLVKPNDSSQVVVAKNGELKYNFQGGADGSWDLKIEDTTLIPLRLSAAVNDPSKMLLGRVWVTGRKSIWRSVTGGAVWTPVDDFVSQTDVRDFASYPNDTSGYAAGLVWAAGSSDATPPPSFEKTDSAEIRGLWISTDYGQTWPYNKLGGYNVSSVAIVSRTSPTNYHVYAAVSASGRDTLLKLTHHNNNNWTPVFSGADEIRMVRVNVSSTSIFLATNDGVYRSTDAYGTDGGGNWSKMTGLPENDVKSIAVGSGSVVFAGTSGSLYRSTDNGATWVNVGDMDVSSVEAMHDGSGQVTWAVSRENNIAAKHNGSSWERRTLGAEGNPFSAERIYRNPHNGRLFVAGASGTTAGLYYSTNGGTSYAVPTFGYTIGSGSRYYGIVAYPGDTLNMVLFGGGTVGGTWKNLFTSSNGGGTWEAAGVVVGSGNASILDMSLRYSGGQTIMFAALSNGKVYRSGNSGVNWSEVLNAGSVARSIAVNRNQPAIVYVGSDSGLWKSTGSGDAGTWQRKLTGDIVRVMMHPSFQNSANRLWVIGNGGNSLYKTTNGGDTLNAVSSGATTPLRALGADLIRYGYSYVAGAGGVLRINEPVGIPTLNKAYYNDHPRLTWTVEESDLASPPFEVYKYYQRCAYLCPMIKNCSAPSTPFSVGTTSSGIWYDVTEYVYPCGGGGDGLDTLVGYYVIVRENTGDSVQTASKTFNRGIGYEQLDKAAVEDRAPVRFFLDANHPNPFNPVTVIRYGLAEDARAVLVLYDVLGREVMRLCDEVQEAGEKSVTVDASRLSSGVYFYRLTAGEFTAVRRMMVLK